MLGRFNDWLFETIEDWFGVVFILAMVGIIAFLVFWANYNSPTILLQKSDWQVTHTRSVTITTYVMVGKVMVPTVSVEEIPDQYTMK